MAGNQFCVSMACEGGYSTNLIVSNGWKSIICVYGMWRRVQSKPDRVKWLEIKPVCVYGMWRRVQSKPDHVKWLEIKPVCVYGMWRRVRSNPDCVKWLEINPTTCMCVHGISGGGGAQGGYSGFQVMGMIEWSQKSRPKKIPRASSKTQKKSLDQKCRLLYNTCDVKQHHS